MYKSHKADMDMDRVIEEYKAATDEGLVSFAQVVRDEAGARIDKPDNKRYYALGMVSERAADDIEGLTGIDAGGYKRSIKGSSIGHIERRHGPNGKQDHSMADINDYGRIQYVLDNYDSIELTFDQNGKQTFSDEFKDSNSRPAPLVTYRKRIDGMFYVIEAVPNAKVKTLQIVSAYKVAGMGKC